MHADLVLSAHTHNIEYYGRVKVVNNARLTIHRLECKRERVMSGFLADITRSPIYNQGLMGSISP